MGGPLVLAAYLALSSVAGPAGRHVLRRRLGRGKEDPARANERFGRPSLPRPEGPLVWLHAASVGEALSILKLVKTLGEIRAELQFLVTTGTVSSSKVLGSRLPARTRHQFIPYDLRRGVRRFLDHWRPAIGVWTESELWPALICETHARGVPMIYVNARMSAASHRRWRRFPGVSGALLGRFRKALVQDAETAGFLVSLGLPEERMEVTGTLKGGADALPCDNEELARLARRLDGRRVWLAASTHPGEEEIVAAAHASAAERVRGLFLIVAPRHPERGQQAADRLRESGIPATLRSDGKLPGDSDSAYIADTLGELGLWFRLAFASFMGGSLFDVGGHNPYEPAALDSAIIHGPHVRNFAEIYKRFGEAGGAIQVDSAGGLADAVVRLANPEAAARFAHAAGEACSRDDGATARAAEVVLSFLPQGSGQN